MLPEPWQIYILVPLAAVVCAIGWSVLDYHRGRSISADVNRRRQSEQVKFCLQVAVAAPVISLGFYAADAAGNRRCRIACSTPPIYWSTGNQ